MRSGVQFSVSLQKGSPSRTAGGAFFFRTELKVCLQRQDKKLEAVIPDLTKFSESVYISSYQVRVDSLESFYNEINRTTREASVQFYSRLDKIPSVVHPSSGVLSLGVRINF